MSRFKFFPFVVGALALLLSVSLLAVDSHGGDKGKDGKGDGKGKKVGQEQIVHGCITEVNATAKTVTFTHPKFGGTVKVDTSTTATKTLIEVCGETKTLAELKTLVDAVKTALLAFDPRRDADAAVVGKVQRISGFLPAIDADYDALRTALRTERPESP